ncbi:MAG TPA: SCP2 sterol-binding domain-containing protein [Thermoleophilaceae bacterium]|nr:SCP2 sterol-binding domain-containing protein [Thermoleophilaceae bacterium]
MDRTQEALKEIAQEEPELAARLVLMTLPGAAARVPGKLTYELAVTGIGRWRVSVDEGRATMTELNGEPTGDDVEFSLSTDPESLASLVTGEGIRAVLGGRVRIRGKRRRALRLRAMTAGDPPGLADAVRQGARLDPDPVYRALQWMIDPAWTAGHSFVVAYDIEGSDGGPWYVQVNDGERVRVTTERPQSKVAATATVSIDTYHRLISGELTPTQAMQRQLTRIEGEIHPVILLGRWIERSQGRDDAEMRREQAQLERQLSRAGSWGALANGAVRAARPGQGDPAHDAEEGKARGGGQIMGYGELYALWERQNWRAHELDFSVDQEQWRSSPAEAQENMTWSFGSFYIGEERVTADLAPFLLAAPSGEVEAFLATQLVDEARHAVFFDRFGAEVMALDADDLRGRLVELERKMLKPWHDVFDDGLREIADRIKARPDDLDLFVEGITTYHMVIEGVLAMTGQRFILKYLSDHGMYPGFQKGFSLVEQDEHRHIAFGVRFLKDMVDSDPRYGEIVQRRVAELVPKAAHVFVPPYADSAREFTSYGYHSSHIYGYAFRALKRRMAVIGLEVPPADELMPGPIAEPDEARAAGAPV